VIVEVILGVATASCVFLLHLLEDAFQRSHEQRLLGFELGVEATLCEARPSIAVPATAARTA
jgi:hypothetical protein